MIIFLLVNTAYLFYPDNVVTNHIGKAIGRNNFTPPSNLKSRGYPENGFTDYLSQGENPTTLSWEEVNVISEPRMPVTPKFLIDSNDNKHILWSNYDDGRSLYHKILFANGSSSENNVIFQKDYGTEISLDAEISNNDTIHLTFSWGTNGYTYRVYYQYWSNYIWSEREQVDPGEDSLGRIISAQKPKITVDENNKPYVIWIFYDYIGYSDEARMGKIYLQTKISGKWTDIDYISEGTPGNYDITINKGFIHVIYSRYINVGKMLYFGNYHKQKNVNGTSWFAERTLFYNIFPDNFYFLPCPLLTRTSEKIHCFINTLTPGAPRIFHYIYKNNYWQIQPAVTNIVGVFGQLTITAAVNSMDDIFLAWPANLDYGGQLLGGIHYSVYSKNNEAWSEVTQLEANYTTAFEPSACFDSNDNVHIIWRDNYQETKQALYYMKGFIDRDGDGLSDIDEETIYFTDPDNNDTDFDELNDKEEILLGMDPLDADEDNDLILDGWEVANSLDPNNNSDATLDDDLDSLTNLIEFGLRTDPNNNDTDADDLSDGQENNIYSTNPLIADTDGDGLLDGNEIFISTNPLSADTDNDGMPDGFEVEQILDPNVDDAGNDEDGDSLNNLEEYLLGTAVRNNDTDNDMLNDFLEVNTYLTNPLNNDTDGDTLLDFFELTIDPLDNQYKTNNTFITDPLEKDSDFDGLDDYYEFNISLTNPLVADTDNDAMLDGYESTYGLNPFLDDSLFDYDNDTLSNLEESLFYSNPFSKDTDLDNLLDDEEISLGTSPINDDTDFDRLKDYSELFIHSTDPLVADMDNDSLNDYEEIFIYFTDTTNPDSDGDGLNDGLEVYVFRSNPILKDSDSDGLADNTELEFKSCPTLRDSDFDGLDDFWEYTYNFSPLINEAYDDDDKDGLVNFDEYRYFTSPRDIDSDNDQLSDFDEVCCFFTNPIAKDTDQDGLDDLQEISVYATSPLDPDCDDDRLLDAEEVEKYFTNPYNPDSDFDGFSDFDEISANTDPNNSFSSPRNKTLIIYVIVFVLIIFVLVIYLLSPKISERLQQRQQNNWITIGTKMREERYAHLREEYEGKKS
jgi:hypothetical protein